MIVKNAENLGGFDASSLITGISNLATAGITTVGNVRMARESAKSTTAIQKYQQQLAAENMKMYLVGGGVLLLALFLLRDSGGKK